MMCDKLLQKIYNKGDLDIGSLAFDTYGTPFIPLDKILINRYGWVKSSQPEIVIFFQTPDMRIFQEMSKNTYKNCLKIFVFLAECKIQTNFLQKMDMVFCISSLKHKMETNHVFFYQIPNPYPDLKLYGIDVAKIITNTLPMHVSIADYDKKLVIKVCCSRFKDTCLLDIHNWGDYLFVLFLKKALEKQRINCIISPYPYWEDNMYSKYKNVLVLRGRYVHKNNPSQNNLMWLIYNPYAVSLQEINGYKHAFVASHYHHDLLVRQGIRNISILLQCTDLDVFAGTDIEKKKELLFVGHKRFESRPSVDYCKKNNLPLVLYGKGWGEEKTVPYDELKNLYSGYQVVLNDHWDDMRELGYISNKCFDIVACGGNLVVDNVRNIKEIFGKFAHIYRNENDFKIVVEKLLQSGSTINPKEFIRHHTYDERGKTIIKFLE